MKRKWLPGRRGEHGISAEQPTANREAGKQSHQQENNHPQGEAGGGSQSGSKPEHSPGYSRQQQPLPDARNQQFGRTGRNEVPQQNCFHGIIYSAWSIASFRRCNSSGVTSPSPSSDNINFSR